MDTVASWGGTPFNMDQLLIDAAYTGSQKVLAAPPGVAPISFNARAMDKVTRRKNPPRSFYLDLNMLGKYWNCFPDQDGVRMYHHTAPVNAMYALREALSVAADQGLEAMWARHKGAAAALHRGLKEMGLELFVADAASRLPTVTTIKVPEGVDWKAVVMHAMKKYGLIFLIRVNFTLIL